MVFMVHFTGIIEIYRTVNNKNNSSENKPAKQQNSNLASKLINLTDIKIIEIQTENIWLTNGVTIKAHNNHVQIEENNWKDKWSLLSVYNIVNFDSHSDNYSNYENFNIYYLPILTKAVDITTKSE